MPYRHLHGVTDPNERNRRDYLRNYDPIDGYDTVSRAFPDARWCEIRGFPGRFVSDDGRVYSVKSGRLQKPCKHNRGYIVYKLSTGETASARTGGGTACKLAHVLVAEAFLPPKPTDRHEVAHNDGTRTNNHFTNLRWATPKENQADRRIHGTHLSGSMCPTSKVTEEIVASIKAEYERGGRRYAGGSVTMQQLADTYGISIAQVSRIVNGKQWLDA